MKVRSTNLAFHIWNELTFLWNELTILWNDLTIDWNDLTWNDLTMERNDRKPSYIQSQQEEIKADLVLKVYALLMRDVLPSSANNSAEDQNSVQEFWK